MPTKFKGDYSFQGHQNVQSANDLGSHHRFIFNIDGPAIAMLVGFFILLCTAAMIYLVVAHGGLVASIVVLSFVLIALCTVAAAIIFLVCFAIRSISTTRAQLHSDKALEHWNRVIYPVGNHVVLYDPTTRTYAVHNARDVVENRHYPAGQTVLPEQAESLMPSLSDLALDPKDSAS